MALNGKGTKSYHVEPLNTSTWFVAKLPVMLFAKPYHTLPFILALAASSTNQSARQCKKALVYCTLLLMALNGKGTKSYHVEPLNTSTWFVAKLPVMLFAKPYHTLPFILALAASSTNQSA
eukprot:c12186_g1_i1 orf=41-403(+)